MKKLLSLFIALFVISLVSCENETTVVEQQAQTEQFKEDLPITQEEIKNVQSVVLAYVQGTECETCKTTCKVVIHAPGSNVYGVRCSNGSMYSATVCDGDIHVTPYHPGQQTPIGSPC